jgi:uncharacterized protein (TIGR03437 family)
MKHSWILLLIGFTAVLGAARAATTLYAGTGGGVCKSIDGGVTWRFIRIRSTDAKLQGALTLRGIVVDPQNPSNVYATGLFLSTSAFLKSTDAGETWSAFAQPSGVSFDLGPGALTIDPAKTNVLYSSSFVTRRFIVSTDGGLTWSEPNIPRPAGAPGTNQPQITGVATDPNRSGVVYAVGPQSIGRVGQGYILQSTDFGATWSILAQGQTFNAHVFVDPRNSQVLYASSNYAVFAGCPAGSTCALYKSSDGGKSWADVPFPSSNVQSLAFDVNPSVMYAWATGAPQPSVWKTTDGGNSWTAVLKNTAILGFTGGGAAVRADPSTAGTVWAVGPLSGGTVSRSTDGGANWTAVPVGSDGVQDIAVAAPPRPLAPPTGSVTRTVSAASQQDGPVAAESIVTSTGSLLATGPATANYDQPPMMLGGTTVNVTDSAGVTRPALLFSVSAAQVTYQMPPGTAAGAAIVTITSGDGVVATAQVQVATVAPGIYTVNSAGLAKGYALRSVNGNLFVEDVFDINAMGAVVARPITISNGDQVTLIVYGTGFRAAGGDFSATAGGTSAPILYAGPQGIQPGVDQFNITIPPEVAAGGAQSVAIVLTAAGQTTNTVYVTVQ